MPLRNVWVLFLMVLVLGMVGCRTAPVFNVTDAPTMATGKNVKLADIEKAIVRAGGTLGWRMKKVKPGHIIGTLFIRKHMAKVDIKYSTKAYSITYRDSENLKYDGSSIHSNYNGWVQNLDRAIRRELADL